MHLFANRKGPVEATGKTMAHVEIRVAIVEVGIERIKVAQVKSVVGFAER